MAIKNGDFILIDYTGRVKETGEVFETTNEEVAKESGVYRANELYEPKLIVVGEGWILKSLEEKLIELDVEKSETIEIPPEKAFGLRDPNKIRMVPLRRFRSSNITPAPGMRIEFEGKLATIRSVGAGRVQLDFNPPLAGKTLIYDVTVKKKLTNKRDKLLALIHRRVPLVEIEKVKLKVTKNIVTITIPREAYFVEGIQFIKRGIAMDILKFFEETSKVSFVESYERREPSEEEPQQETD
ncbi:MAG: FKBP-type peptidyl-prolyl cis-trans isomerase [Candidatus Asgardarchaeia archaeon]